MDNHSSAQVLKNLHAVLVLARERYSNQFVVQEVRLTEEFRDAFSAYLSGKGCGIEYFEHTSVVTNRQDQLIFIPNQWFVMASYFVDFCTELLTYREYFIRTCTEMGLATPEAKKSFATRMKSAPVEADRQRFEAAAGRVLAADFPGNPGCSTTSVFLWKFASDYGWWAGSKTADRHDFYISALLNQLNVVNANSEFLAEIVFSYASNYRLRLLTEDPENFTEGLEIRDYAPTETEQEAYEESEKTAVPAEGVKHAGISISAASLERFHASMSI